MMERVCAKKDQKRSEEIEDDVSTTLLQMID